MGEESFIKHILFFTSVALSVIFLNLIPISPVFAQTTQEPVVLEITGEGVERSVQFTLSKLQTMEQYRQVYSTINTWPTKTWYVAEGVKLQDLFKQVGLKNNAQLISFTSKDGFTITLTVKELLVDKRYYYPNFMDTGQDGSIPGSSKGAIEVQPILALLSAEGSTNYSDMNDMNSLLLVCGQRTVTEQTNNLFLKNVSKIEVFTDELLQWDPPKATIVHDETTGEAFVELTSKVADTDKIHYTTDGTIPTANSPMFNWRANRWRSQWSSSTNNSNQGIKINKDTIIKAITIGPGKLDSEVVTITFRVNPEGKIEMANKMPTGITLDQNTLALKVGASFSLDATVNIEEIIDENLIWESSNTRVATVDSNGLVSIVGQGETIITVRTITGNYTATCIVTGISTDGNLEDIDANLTAVDEVNDNFENWQAETREEHEVSNYKDEEKETPVENIEAESNLHYLVSKSEFAVADNSNIKMMENGAWKVFEISLDEEAVTSEPATNEFIGISFLSLFFLGAGKRYKKFKGEKAN